MVFINVPAYCISISIKLQIFDIRNSNAYRAKCMYKNRAHFKYIVRFFLTPTLYLRRWQIGAVWFWV